MFGKKKLKRGQEVLAEVIVEENKIAGEKVLEAVAEEEVYVDAEVEKEVEAVAEDNIIAEVETEEIVFLDATIDSQLDDEDMVQFDEEKTDEAQRIAEAARKVAEAAHKLLETNAEIEVKPETEQSQTENKVEEIKPEIINSTENKPAELNSTNVKPNEVCSIEVKTTENKTAEINSTENKTAEVKSTDIVTIEKADVAKSETAELEEIILDAEAIDEDVSKDDKKEASTIISGIMKEVKPKDGAVASNDENADLDEIDVPKPAKLAKLPIFVDYCVTQNLKFKTYVKVAKVLVGTFKLYKDSPENKELVLGCIKKLLPALAKAKAESKTK